MLQHPNPIIGILASIRAVKSFPKGQTKLEESSLITHTLNEALQYPWNSPALFCGYFLPDYPEHRFRLNLARLNHAYQSCFALDLDTPNHEPLTQHPSFVAEVREKFGHLPSILKSSLRAFYTTESGVHFVFVYQTPVTAPQHELILDSYILPYFKRAALPVDEAALKRFNANWTLPRIEKAPGRRTESLPTFECSIFPELSLPGDAILAQLGQNDKSQTTNSLAQSESTLAMLHTKELPKATKEHFHKQARAILKNASCFPYLFQTDKIDIPFAFEGERDSKLFSLIATLVRRLRKIEGSSPDLIASLIYPLVHNWETDPKTGDWETRIDHQTSRLWSEVESKEVQEQAQAQVTLSTLLKAHLETYATARPSLSQDEIRQQLFLTQGKNVFVLREDGFYDNRAYDQADVYRLSALPHFDGIIRYQELTKTGMKLRPKEEILFEHARALRETIVVSKPEVRGSFLSLNRQTLFFNPFQFNPQTRAEYNADVDEWIHAFAGSYYSYVIEWLSYALDLSAPLPALSYIGKPAAGKKLLVQGLSECFEFPNVCNNPFSEFHSTLLKTPVININEGIANPKGHVPYAHIRNEFRRLSAGDSFEVNIKYMTPMTSKVCYRTIITANNDAVIRTLIGDSKAGKQDTAALSSRIFHLDMSENNDASELLESKGYRHTDGWIARDGSGDSDYTIANHIRFLHENREVKDRQGRFLFVPPAEQEEVIRQIRAESDTAIDVLSRLMDFVNMVYKQATDPAYSTQGRWLYRSGMYLTDEPSLYVNRNSLYLLNNDDYTRREFYELLDQYTSENRKSIRVSRVDGKGSAIKKFARVKLSVLIPLCEKYDIEIPYVIRLALGAGNGQTLPTQSIPEQEQGTQENGQGSFSHWDRGTLST